MSNSQINMVCGIVDLTFKAPVRTEADNIHKYFFIIFFFQRKYDMIFHENQD